MEMEASAWIDRDLAVLGLDLFAQRYRIEQLSNWRRAGYYKVGKGDEGRRESQMSPLQHLDELRRQYGLVTILCHERTGHCHRYILQHLANDKGSRAHSG